MAYLQKDCRQIFELFCFMSLPSITFEEGDYKAAAATPLHGRGVPTDNSKLYYSRSKKLK